MAMAIRTIQTLINIGTSKGITLPAKDLKYEGIETGDELEVIVRKRNNSNRAKDTLPDEYAEFKEQYGETLKKLADR